MQILNIGVIKCDSSKADEMEPAVAAAITKAGLWGKIVGKVSDGGANLLKLWRALKKQGTSAVDDARRRAVTEFERWQRRAPSNIDSLKLFATLNEAYPLICMIQKCLLACLPRNQIAKNSSLFLVYSKVYSCIVCL